MPGYDANTTHTYAFRNVMIHVCTYVYIMHVCTHMIYHMKPHIGFSVNILIYTLAFLKAVFLHAYVIDTCFEHSVLHSTSHEKVCVHACTQMWLYRTWMVSFSPVATVVPDAASPTLLSSTHV